MLAISLDSNGLVIFSAPEQLLPLLMAVLRGLSKYSSSVKTTLMKFREQHPNNR